MSRVQSMLDRMRSRGRREVAGVDDGKGVVGDEPPAPVVPRQPQPRRLSGPVVVPRGLEVAAAWSWRALLVAGLVTLICWLVAFFAVLVVPVAIALLIAALVVPAVDRLQRLGMSRALAAGLVVVAVLVFIGGALTLVGQQLATGFGDLADQVVDGIAQVEDWLRTGPLNLTQKELSDGLAKLQEAVTSGNDEVVTRVAEFGSTLGHVVGGFFLVLFSTYFFLYEGSRIWGWVVRLFPAEARVPTDEAGRASWVSLTAFVRATVIVALVDAIGITLAALILRVPLALPIGVLVFLGAFIPIIGAALSGMVAVLVALVAHGPLVALLMLAAVVLVQQLESHILQPFLLGRAVRLHPLAVIFAIAAGVLAAGIIGALVAVPLVAVLNTAVSHLAGTDPAAPGDHWRGATS